MTIYSVLFLSYQFEKIYEQEKIDRAAYVNYLSIYVCLNTVRSSGCYAKHRHSHTGQYFHCSQT